MTVSTKIGLRQQALKSVDVRLTSIESIDLIHERVIVRLRHSLPDGKLQKEGRTLCFTAGLL